MIIGIKVIIKLKKKLLDVVIWYFGLGELKCVVLFCKVFVIFFM